MPDSAADNFPPEAGRRVCSTPCSPRTWPPTCGACFNEQVEAGSSVGMAHASGPGPLRCRAGQPARGGRWCCWCWPRCSSGAGCLSVLFRDAALDLIDSGEALAAFPSEAGGRAEDASQGADGVSPPCWRRRRFQDSSEASMKRRLSVEAVVINPRGRSAAGSAGSHAAGLGAAGGQGFTRPRRWPLAWCGRFLEETRLAVVPAADDRRVSFIPIGEEVFPRFCLRLRLGGRASAATPAPTRPRSPRRPFFPISRLPEPMRPFHPQLHPGCQPGRHPPVCRPSCLPATGWG